MLHLSLGILLSCVCSQDFDRGLAAPRLMQVLKAQEVPAFASTGRNVQQAKFEHYPKDAGACVSIAKRIGEDMARVTGVKVLGSVCEGEDETGYKIVVSYEAAEPLNLVSTAKHRLMGSGFGAYKDPAECKAALPGEIEAFKQATGLDPVAAYCFQDPLARDDAWSIRIDSFGRAKLDPDVQYVLVFTYPQGWTRERFTGKIKSQLEKQGVNVRTVAWRPDSGYATVEVGYYAAERMELKIEEAAKVDSKAQCEAAKAEVDKLLAGRTPEPLIHYCGNTMVGGWELAWLFKGAPSLKTVKASEEFKTYDACMAGRRKVMDYYRESMGHSVAGSVCSHEVLDYSWKVILLE
ncbi:MAG: hypothetical protein WC728_19025 [Elusimicrobiota bacterium]